ncbi:MAG: hypothetical protein ACHQT6_10055 [Candidatus Acidiferrales bacterium]
MATQPPVSGITQKFCYQCGKNNPDQAFCGACGSPLSLNEYISARVKTQLADTIRDRDVLEMDSSVKVFTQAWGWMKLIFVIVAALLVVTGASVFWKASDFWSSVDKAKQSVGDTAKKSGEEISQISSQAKHDLSETARDIKETRDTVVKLKEQVSARSAEVQTLGTRIKDFDAQVATFKTTVDSQSQQLQRLTDEVTAVKTTRNEINVLNAYPALGEHMAGSNSGWIDPKQKESGMTYLTLSLALGGKPNIDRETVAGAMTVLTNNKYKVFLGFVGLYVGTPATSNTGIGAPLRDDSCTTWLVPPTGAPCILYFREVLRGSAMRARDLVKTVQMVPDTRIFFVNPKQLTSDKQELLNLSHMDIVVVLGESR